MLKLIAGKVLDSTETKLGASMDYLREMLKYNPGAFFKFSKIMGPANYRKHASAEVLAVARIAALRVEDCGPCVQIGANIAVSENVDPEIVRVAATGSPDEVHEKLSEDLARIWSFATAVSSNDPNYESLREQVKAQQGEKAMIEIAMAIATARVPPALKRGLGYAVECSKVEVKV